jgi:hypothetical protein
MNWHLVHVFTAKQYKLSSVLIKCAVSTHSFIIRLLIAFCFNEKKDFYIAGDD